MCNKKVINLTTGKIADLVEYLLAICYIRYISEIQDSGPSNRQNLVFIWTGTIFGTSGELILDTFLIFIRYR